MSHPVIGLWAVEIKYADRPRVDRGTLLFHPDGSLSLAFTEHSSHAVWQSSGERTATITGTRPVGPSEGFVGWYMLSAGASVSDDGMDIHISAKQSRPRPDGSLMEQSGDITGSRVVPQPA
jgi:hypothetical protein